MKILFITSSSINGGAQKHIKEMFKGLQKLGHDLFLVAPHGWLTDELKDYENKIICMDLKLKNISKLKLVFDQIEPDITNTFILSGGVFGTLAWRKKKYGKIFTTVNNPVIYPGISKTGRVIYPWLYRWMSQYTSAFLVKADKVRDEVARIIKNKKPVISIKNGIDFNVFNKEKKCTNLRTDFGIGYNDIVITNVAVLNARKGQQFLINAIIELRKNYHVHLWLVGEGPDENHLKNIVTENNGNDYIHFLGRRSDINVILSNSDVFVLSSLHEGLPNALMEAMAMGLPCVATDVGGVRQLIDDKVNGIVIRSESDLEIKEKVEWLIDNPDERRIYGELSFQKMKKEYDQDIVLHELVDIYKNY